MKTVFFDSKEGIELYFIISSKTYRFLLIIGEFIATVFDTFNDLYWFIKLNLSCSWGDITWALFVLPVSCNDLFQ